MVPRTCSAMELRTDLDSVTTPPQSTMICVMEITWLVSDALSVS